MLRAGATAPAPLPDKDDYYGWFCIAS